MKTLLLCLCLAGCAQDRYLTAEEDAELRAKCEATNCAIVPMPLWIQIEALIKRFAGTEI